MEEIIKILEEIKPGIQFDKNTELIDSKLLDSLAMISLVAELSDEFDVEITAQEIIPDNFKTVSAIYDMIQRLEDED